MAPESLWLGYSDRADAWQSIWLDDASRLQLTSARAPAHGFGLSYHRVRIALMGEGLDSARSLAQLCATDHCWLFDTEKLQISSVFPKTAVSELDYSVGVHTSRVDHPLSWRPALSPSLDEAYLSPVIDDIRRLGGLPRIELLVDGDASCLGTEEWRRYRETVETAANSFNRAAHLGEPVRWQISVMRESDESCEAKPSFPDKADLATAWARWQSVEVTAAHHAWQAINAVATLASPAWSMADASGEATLEQGRAEARRIEAIRSALDRDPDDTTQLDNPACVGDDDVDVWRIAPEHSVVVDRPSRWKASGIRPLLSSAHILRGDRKINDEYLTYFKLEGDGWRFAVFDLAAKQEAAGALMDKLPRYCVLDPIKREVLQMDRACDDCLSQTRRTTW